MAGPGKTAAVACRATRLLMEETASWESQTAGALQRYQNRGSSVAGASSLAGTQEMLIQEVALPQCLPLGYLGTALEEPLLSHD